MEVTFKINYLDMTQLLAARNFLDRLLQSRELPELPKPVVQEVPKSSPPPPPPAIAPVAEPTPTPPQPAPAAPINGTFPQTGPTGVLVDSAGLPWDSRINSDNKKCVAKDGRWRKRRNCDPKLYDEVVAELMSKKIGEQVKTLDPPPPPPAKVDGPAELTFSAFMEWVTKQNPKYTDAEGLNELVKQVGLDSIALLAVHQQHIPKLVEIVQNGQQSA